jgi:formylglycine-generating enzyme required for sulfatase activity
VAGGSVFEKRAVKITSRQSPSLLGKVTIKTQPADAKIYLNNAYVGKGNKKLTLKSGAYNLTAKKIGYNEVSEDIYVSVGDELKVTLILNTPEDDNYSSEYEFKVNRTPRNARVRILNIKEKYYDGIRLEPGKYRIEVSKKGYKKIKRLITLGEADKTVTVKLKKLGGSSGHEMVQIAGDCFQMGSPKSEKGRGSDEKRHKVCVDDFKIGKYEVTVGQFRKFVRATGYETDAEKNAGGNKGCYAWSESDGKYAWRKGVYWNQPGFEQKNKEPVVCVSFRDVMKYIDWINKKTGQTFRLTTEAEWEYAARAGTTTARYWGDNSSQACRYANVADQTTSPKGHSFNPKHECNDGHWYTAVVGNYKPNAFGLYDMLGNVWEWNCSDWSSDYNGQEKRCSSKKYATGFRSIRGGSWDGKPTYVRSATRTWADPLLRITYIGFRLAQD